MFKLKDVLKIVVLIIIINSYLRGNPFYKLLLLDQIRRVKKLNNQLIFRKGRTSFIYKKQYLSIFMQT